MSAKFPSGGGANSFLAIRLFILLFNFLSQCKNIQFLSSLVDNILSLEIKSCGCSNPGPFQSRIIFFIIFTLFFIFLLVCSWFFLCFYVFFLFCLGGDHDFGHNLIIKYMNQTSVYASNARVEKCLR